VTRVIDGPHTEHDAPIPTWFRVGGRADTLARPTTADELRRLIELDPDARILGDGANLLVADGGVRELVVSLEQGDFTSYDIDERSGVVRVGAGAKLPTLISACVSRGLAGIEGLAGIPASLGGALVMNAGGSFGEIARVVESVDVFDRRAGFRTLSKHDCDFAYRHSSLTDFIVVGATLRLEPTDPGPLKDRRREVAEYKARTQPMSSSSAGCAFRNPTLAAPINDIGDAGQRVSAGMLIDRAGCKGLRAGGACVSEHHANFITTDADASASDVLSLMREVQRRVHDAFGVEIVREVVVWGEQQ